MPEATAVLFGIEDEFDVASVDRTGPGPVQIIIEMRSREAPCPACGVLSGRLRERPLYRVKDLPASGQTELWWRKRRLLCREPLCPRRSFTQTSDAVRPRARLTERLRDQVAHAIAGSNRAVAEVAREYGVSWPTAHKALIAAAARWLPEPEPTPGWASTRPGSGRCAGCWTGSPGTVGSMADQLRRLLAGRCWIVAGVGSCRTGGCVRDWLAEQTQEFRDAVELVIIDPSAPYASGIRAALPGVQIAVDKWHLVALANQMVTEVRQRVTRELLGRRGTTADPIWVNRRLLLTGADHLSAKQWQRLNATLERCDPTQEIGAAWGADGRLGEASAPPTPRTS